MSYSRRNPYRLDYASTRPDSKPLPPPVVHGRLDDPDEVADLKPAPWWYTLAVFLLALGVIAGWLLIFCVLFGSRLTQGH